MPVAGYWGISLSILVSQAVRKSFMGIFGPLHTFLSLCDLIFLSVLGMNKHLTGITGIMLKTSWVSFIWGSQPSHQVSRAKIISSTFQVENKNLRLRQVVICSKINGSLVVQAELWKFWLAARSTLLNQHCFSSMLSYEAWVSSFTCVGWVQGPHRSYGPWTVQFSSVQSLSCVRVFATLWIAARQASLSITNSQTLNSYPQRTFLLAQDEVFVSKYLFLKC